MNLVDRTPTVDQLIQHDTARIAALSPPVTRHPVPTARDMAAADQRFSRQQLANGHKQAYAEAMSEYEQARHEAHEALRRKHAANMAYSVLTGG